MGGVADPLTAGDDRARTLAAGILEVPREAVVEVGLGETFACWGARDEVVLLPRTITGATAVIDVIARCADVAIRHGVRTPRVVRMGSDPRPHAVLERVWATPADDDPSARARLYEAVGGQLASLHQAAVTGAGDVVVVDGELRGQSRSWPNYCDGFVERFLNVEGSDPAVATVRSLGDLDDTHWRAFADRVREHGEQEPKLCHYDNRLANLPVDPAGAWILDWNLARVAPLSHELIKLYERPPDQARADATALLNGYGVQATKQRDVMNDSLTALAMDGLAMSLEWASEPRFHGGIRGWMSTVKNVITRAI